MSSKTAENGAEFRQENQLQQAEKQQSNTSGEKIKLVVDRDANKSDGVSLWNGSSKLEKCLLVDLIVVEFLLFFCASIPSPFFSRVVVKKGGTVFESAVILQSLMLSLTASSLLFGKYLPRFGCKALFHFGIIVAGTCQILLGVLQYIDNLAAFITLGVLFRFLGGIGDAALTTASMTIVGRGYTKHLTKVFGLFETAGGLAYLAGPLIGGFLYEKGEMILPFAVSGGMVLLTVPIHCMLLRSDWIDDQCSDTASFELQSLFCKPQAIATLTSVGCVFGIVAYFEVALTVYLKTLEFSTTYAGLVIFTMALGFGMFSAPVGYLVSASEWAKPVAMIVGSVFLAAIVLLYYPHQRTAVIYVAAGIFGAAAALAAVPALEILMTIANGGPVSAETDTALYSHVTGIWYAAMGIGMFLFPIIASVVEHAINSFFYTLVGLSVFMFVVTIANAAAFLVELFSRRYRVK